jgi:hypothetical protein
MAAYEGASPRPEKRATYAKNGLPMQWPENAAGRLLFRQTGCGLDRAA